MVASTPRRGSARGPPSPNQSRTIEQPRFCAVIGIIGLQSVNLSYSRSTGDLALAEISRRIVANNSPTAIVERIGGNRFALLTSTADVTIDSLGRLATQLSKPIETPLGSVVLGCAIGAIDGDAISGLVMLDRADRNLTVAMRRGAGVIKWDNAPSMPITHTPARLASTLAAAVAGGAVSAHFQPVVNVATGRTVELEAFARWDISAFDRLDASRSSSTSHRRRAPSWSSARACWTRARGVARQFGRIPSSTIFASP